MPDPVPRHRDLPEGGPEPPETAGIREQAGHATPVDRVVTPEFPAQGDLLVADELRVVQEQEDREQEAYRREAERESIYKIISFC